LSRARVAIVALGVVALIAGAVLLPGLLAGRSAGGRGSARLPAAVSVVAHYARAIPARPRTRGPKERLLSAPVRVNGRPAELVAAPVPEARLVMLAASLPT